MADAPDLGSGGETRGGSSPPSRTTPFHQFQASIVRFFMELALSLFLRGSLSHCSPNLLLHHFESIPSQPECPPLLGRPAERRHPGIWPAKPQKWKTLESFRAGHHPDPRGHCAKGCRLSRPYFCIFRHNVIRLIERVFAVSVMRP